MRARTIIALAIASVFLMGGTCNARYSSGDGHSGHHTKSDKQKDDDSGIVAVVIVDTGLDSEGGAIGVVSASAARGSGEPAAAIPEPAAGLLFAIGSALVAARLRRPAASRARQTGDGDDPVAIQ